MIRVLLVDDHALMRAGVKTLLESEPGIEVVGESSNGEDVLELVKEFLPDVILMDIKMPGIGGMEATRRVVHFFPKIKVIALTACTSEPILTRMLQFGAVGYVSKVRPFADLLEAIYSVYHGGRYISPDIAHTMAIKHIYNEDISPYEDLSEREIQVMLLIVKGNSVNEISEKLCLSQKTVNTYRYRLFAKLRVRSNVELTRLAVDQGFLDHESDAE